ncbi:MAG: hypothetical protein ABW194_05055 [Novosphingobium sp.]
MSGERRLHRLRAAHRESETREELPMNEDTRSGSTAEDRIRDVAERVLELESELEASGEAALDADALDFAREALHKWVDTVVGVVASPGVGRAMLIHADGHESKIASPNLPFLLSRPAKFGNAG